MWLFSIILALFGGLFACFLAFPRFFDLLHHLGWLAALYHLVIGWAKIFLYEGSVLDSVFGRPAVGVAEDWTATGY